MVRRFHNNRFNIAKLPRQTGKSTTVVAYLMHYALFNDNVNIGILKQSTNCERTSRKVTTCIRELANMVAAGYHCMEQRIYGAENGSKILASSTSASAVRGMSFNIIFLDEFAFIPNHIAEQFFTSFILLFRLVKAQKSSSSQRRMG